MATTAKQRLLKRLNDWIVANEKDVGVATQMNVSHAREQYGLLSQVSDEQAEQMEESIKKKESYDPAKDRFNFGPVTVSPLDIMAFLDDDSREEMGLRRIDS